MFRHIARSLPHELIAIDPMAMNIDCQKGVSIFFWPGVSLVNHRPAMRVPSARHIVLRIFGALRFPVPSSPMDVISDTSNQLKGVRIEVLSKHPLVACARNNMEQMFDDAV